ncbi:hypothetical protein SDC9_82230 [bioreactor metagenome]|uniref:Uncharacterized protein n=1 Tax=bioreactor metagenome TaxID=1076179 RepID=A0A644Z4V0_9ZZZZ
MLLNLSSHRLIEFLAIGFVVLPCMTETAAVRTAAHNLHHPIILGHLEVGHYVVGIFVADRWVGKLGVHISDSLLFARIPEERKLFELFKFFRTGKPFFLCLLQDRHHHLQ